MWRLAWQARGRRCLIVPRDSSSSPQPRFPHAGSVLELAARHQPRHSLHRRNRSGRGKQRCGATPTRRRSQPGHAARSRPFATSADESLAISGDSRRSWTTTQKRWTRPLPCTTCRPNDLIRVGFDINALQKLELDGMLRAASSSLRGVGGRQ
jgi:hypothetical protein